jgi:hypothetical protein
MFESLYKYIFDNKIISIVGVYFLFSSVLKLVTDIDICIPCVWKTMFDIQCLGCGLTTAFISLLEFDLMKAYESNWLIYVILPFGLITLHQDYVKHRNKIISRQNTPQNDGSDI